MAKMVNSNIEPMSLQPDIVQGGRVRLLVHWDAVQQEITDDTGTRTEWEYQEQALWIPIPDPKYIDTTGPRLVLSVAGREYLAANEAEIVAWAQAGMVEATEVPGMRRYIADLEDAITELSILIAGGGV